MTVSTAASTAKTSSTTTSITTATTTTSTTTTQTSMHPTPPLATTNNTTLCCLHTSSDLLNLHDNDNEKYEDASCTRKPTNTMMTTTSTTTTTTLATTPTAAALSEGANSRRASSSRLSRLSSHPTFSAGIVSSSGGNSSSWLGGYSASEIVEDQQNEHEPTSALLDYCKRKFLRPYVAILSLVGLNPISTDTTTYRACCSYIQALFVLCVLLFGYFLRYLCAYRGDRGFTKYREIQPYPSLEDDSATSMHTIGDLLFGYVIPSMLNMLGFLSAIIVCKVIDHEQLQNLIERVFLMSSKPNHLCRMLWLYLGCGFMLFLMLFAYACCAVLMQPAQIVKIIWIAELLKDWETCMRVTLLATVFVQDLVEIVILCGYYIECYLLRVHLETLSHKLLMHSIDCLDWMREMLEFRKQLERLNQRAAVPVCFLIVMNLAYAFAGFVYLFKDFDFHYCALKVVVLNIVNVLLWLFLGLLPFFMAASVTRACQAAQANGHQIRVRPFVYHNTPNDDLDSTLLFASSLDMSAKLFRMPVQSNYLCFAILVVTIVILTLGMCLNLTALGHM